MPKHATVLVVSSGVISNSWVFRTPRSHVTLWWWNASGHTVISLPGTYLALLVELDLYLGEYINHLFHDGCPLQWGCDTLAAVRRFSLSWRDGTFLAKSCLRNWSRTQHVRRAVPLSLEVLLGFCGFHALFSRWHVVGTLYVGFICLLRTGEILTLQGGQITLSVDSSVALLVLPASKGAKLKNVGESIVVSDPTARALLAFLCRGCLPQDRVFRLSF